MTSWHKLPNTRFNS